MPDAASAVVVGAGVFGAAIAHELAGRGWDVTLVEQASPGHVRASSGGESRILRYSHGTDPWYAGWTQRARSAWVALAETSGRDLFVPCGAAWFAHRTDGWEAASARTLRACGIACEQLAHDRARALFPSLGTDDLAFVLFEPDAGVLRARDAVATLAAQAVRRGARVVTGSARPDGDAVAVGGRRLGADVVVWAAGAWLATLFSGLVDLHVTQQDVCFFGAPPGWQAARVPAWVDYDQAAYGLGDLDGRGVKCAPDVEGPEFDPDAGARAPLPANVERARAYLSRRFPALHDAPLVGTRTCQYSLTADTNFLMDRHPGHDRVWLVGGGSGHGFKHGPPLAEYLADVMEGRQQLDPRFRLGPRQSASALRTAGGR